ncbi:hypothetical protein [Roseateles paludis]|uniref:Solute-binding protein family 3/N-terminal domain-containing protein n=1 Tax=Roseateles paludis TaxID=3145238 RepID=A0ABV0FX29_9BURK
MTRSPAHLKTLLCLGLALLAGAGHAACSRVLDTPVAPTGRAVVVEGDEVSGVYPGLLRAAQAAAGCQFGFRVVPRARQFYLFFDVQESDAFVPATRKAEREAQAQFVPIVRQVPHMATLRARPDLPADLDGLRRHPTARLVTVRTYSWGDEYDEFVRSLEAQRRIEVVGDLPTVLTLLKRGRADFTILPATLIYSVAPRPEDALVYRPIAGMAPIEVGVYLSRARIPRAERDEIARAVAETIRQGELLKQFRQHYPESVLRIDLQSAAGPKSH